jgi:hypothetical protein
LIWIFTLGKKVNGREKAVLYCGKSILFQFRIMGNYILDKQMSPLIFAANYRQPPLCPTAKIAAKRQTSGSFSFMWWQEK